MGHCVGQSLSPYGQGQQGAPPAQSPHSSSPGVEGVEPSQAVCAGALAQERCLHPAPSPHGAVPTAALGIHVKTLCMWPCNDFRREVHLIFIRCVRLWFYKLMEHMSAKAPKQSCCLQKLLADVLFSETLCGKPVLHLVLCTP